MKIGIERRPLAAWESGVAETAARPLGREVEVKFRADDGALAAVAASALLKGASVGKAQELVSTYFESPAFDLQRAGLSLRVRRKGRAIPLMGVKWESGVADEVFARGEAEVRCPGGIPDPALLEGAIRERVVKLLETRPLTPIFETRIKRRALLVTHGHSTIELSLDEGSIIAGGASLPVAEVELELKSGNLPDLLDFAASLARDCGLSLAFEAKSARGYNLAKGDMPQIRKAKPITFQGAINFDDLIAAVIANCISHFVDNWAALRASDAPEAIHQLRVSLRRLRGALGVFRKVIDLPELEEIRSEARRIASALGPARECDVFRVNALGGPFRDEAHTITGVAQLLAAVEARRQESYAEARRVMDDSMTSLFVLDVQSFLARRAWRTALAPENLGLLTSDARAYAGDSLDRLRRRVIKRGKHLPDMPDDERHELRIALKNLRYATEFFGGLFSKAKEVRAFLKHVEDLQEDLGAHNDAVTAQAFVAALTLPPQTEASFASGYLLGWLRHGTVIADTHLKKKWKDFRHAPLFWS